jgi:hypothetical protein
MAYEKPYASLELKIAKIQAQFLTASYPREL